MRKMFIIMMFILLFLCGCESKNNNVEKNITEQVTTIKVDESASEETSIKSENTTTTKKTTTSIKNESTTSNSNDRTTTKKTTSTTTKKTSSSKTTTKNPTTNNTSSNKVCSDNDSGLVNHLSAWKKKNPNSMPFFSLKEAKEYGEYAAKNFGYGYWYNPHAQTVDGTLYIGENCYKEIYAVELYVPNTECTDKDGNKSKMMYIPATPKNKLIDKYSYLRKKGYDCGEREWFVF